MSKPHKLLPSAQYLMLNWSGTPRSAYELAYKCFPESGPDVISPARFVGTLIWLRLCRRLRRSRTHDTAYYQRTDRGTRRLLADIKEYLRLSSLGPSEETSHGS